jgi:hypothetical protein
MRELKVDYIKTDGGIFIPELPILKGWTCDKTGQRYRERNNLEFRKDALERLYIIVNPGGGIMINPIDKTKKDLLKHMIDQLAVELVGGKPEDFVEYT